MYPREIYDVIEAIAGTSSKTEKENLIRENINDSDFLYVINAALDPFVTYGIANIPLYSEETGRRSFNEKTKDLLDSLATRKLTGNAARDAVREELESLEWKSARLLTRILTKDLRAGFSASTVNKVRPGTIATFECMLAHPYKDNKSKTFPVAVEPKIDGVRVLTFVNLDTNEVRFLSRSGREFNTFDHLKPHAIHIIELVRMHYMMNENTNYADLFMTAVIDAEVVTSTFNDTVSQVRKKDVQAADARLCVFDILPGITFVNDSKKGCKIAGKYIERRELIETVSGFLPKEAPVMILESRIVNSEEAVYALYEFYQEQGLEGAIVKDLDALYQRRRSHSWGKIKAEETVDLRVIDTFKGTGKYAGKIGGVIVEYSGVRVRVGSGLDDALRECDPEMFIGRLIEIEYHEVTPDGSLRHPRFVRFRDDKDTGKESDGL